MKKIYILFLLFLSLTTKHLSAQCPTAFGMVAVPVSLNGNCFINIQFAWPNSNVSIYNGNGYIAHGTANATGNIILPYPCASNPVTSVISIRTSPSIQTCNTVTITQLVTLPVKLVSFSANLSSRKTVILSWETSLELNNELYEIERSIDGISYTKIGSLNSDGSGLVRRNYTFEDAAFPIGGTALYRLRQVDYDGKFSYSKVVYVSDKTSATGSYSIFPNPLSGSNNFQLKGIAASEVTYSNIRITDMAGRNVAYKITGSNSLELNASAQAGIYILRIKEQTLKLVKN